MAQTLSSLKQESNFFLDLNNDITRMLQAFDNDQNIKKLLYYLESDALSRDDVEVSLMDDTICRVPLVPLESKIEKDASYIMVDLLGATAFDETRSLHSMVGVDILTPLSQWVIDEGLRPLIIGKYVNDIFKYKYEQTGGVKYRLTDIINIRLTDRLVGYRLVYETGLDD